MPGKDEEHGWPGYVKAPPYSARGVSPATPQLQADMAGKPQPREQLAVHTVLHTVFEVGVQAAIAAEPHVAFDVHAAQLVDAGTAA